MNARSWKRTVFFFAFEEDGWRAGCVLVVVVVEEEEKG